MKTYAVIDFETTGLSPGHGARPTEIAVVLVNKDGIKDHYQSLMNPGVHISSDIQALTGITNAMVRAAPSIADVMQKAMKFVGSHPLVAHNAAFDRKFWDAELQRIKLHRHQEFACSLLLSRRIFPDAPNHKLGTLVQMLRLPDTGRSHRALADAEATAHLFLCLQQELMRRFQLPDVSHELLLAIQGKNRSQLDGCVRDYRNDLVKKKVVAPSSPSQQVITPPSIPKRYEPQKCGQVVYGISAEAFVGNMELCKKIPSQRIAILTIQQWEDGPWLARAYKVYDIAFAYIKAVPSLPLYITENQIISAALSYSEELQDYLYDSNIEPLDFESGSDRLVAANMLIERMKRAYLPIATLEQSIAP